MYVMPVNSLVPLIIEGNCAGEYGCRYLDLGGARRVASQPVAANPEACITMLLNEKLRKSDWALADSCGNIFKDQPWLLRESGQTNGGARKSHAYRRESIVPSITALVSRLIDDPTNLAAARDTCLGEGASKNGPKNRTLVCRA